MRIGDFRQSYEHDEAIWQTPTSRFWLAALAVLLLLFPLGANGYIIGLACVLGIHVIAAAGLNIMTGYTGLISLGHAAFMGVGCYTAAYLAQRGVPFWLTIPAGGAMCALLGLVVGIPSLRIKGLYLAVATLAMQFILIFVFREWESVTGGVRGVSVPDATLFGMELDNDYRMYYVILPCAALLLVAARNLFRTRIGRAFIAIRDKDISAEVLGIDLFKYKLLAFAIGSFYAGVAGALLGYVVANETDPKNDRYDAPPPPPPPRERPVTQADPLESRKAEANRQFLVAMAAKDMATTEYHLRESLSLYPTPQAHNNLGLVYLDQGDRDRARENFRAALSLDPKYEPALQNLEKLGATSGSR